MGNCVSSKNCSESKRHSKYFESLEAEHLHLMYQDLSSRSLTPGIIREQFDIFFHLNGLWSASIYKKFDTDKKGYISYEEFSENLLLMTKGSFDEKSQILFDIYNDGQSSGVTYGMLTKMFYSYPKEEINRMVVEEKFLRTIDSYQLACYFDKDKKIKDHITLDLGENYSVKNKEEEALPAPQQRKKMMQGIDVLKKLNQNSASSEGPYEKNEMFLKSMPLQSKYTFQCQKQTKIRRNSYEEQKNLKALNFKLTSNITFLVKKYVSFLFKTFEVDINTGRLNLDQFRTLLRNHEKIFNVYFNGFHTEVWQANDQGLPLYKSIQVTFSSEVIERNKTVRTPRYLVLIKNTLFVFNKKCEQKPFAIKNLEGLHVKNLKSYEPGIIVFHRDGIYPEKQYIFTSKDLKDEWLVQLNDFVKGNINDDFDMIETVGAGKFAKVYYGKQKGSNQEVAIKVIEKNKLTKFEKDSIQKQCSILQLCHHPYIIKFIKHYETKNNMYIITQYLSEGDLFQYVKDKMFLQEYEAALIFKQIVESIQYLNEIGLIHRDLKPENVMIQLNQEKNMIKKVKIIDFGFAIYKKELQIIPQQQKYAGTPGYMAPQIINQEDYDEGSDMFSLGNFQLMEGIILYFMLSGFLPFYSPIYEQIVEQTKICNVTLRNSHWSNVSKPAKQLVQGLLTFKESRMTINQVINHEWLKGLEGLKQFKGMNRRPNKR